MKEWRGLKVFLLGFCLGILGTIAAFMNMSLLSDILVVPGYIIGMGGLGLHFYDMFRGKGQKKTESKAR